MYILYHFYAMKLNLLKKHLIKKKYHFNASSGSDGRQTSDGHELLDQGALAEAGRRTTGRLACRDRCKYFF